MTKKILFFFSLPIILMGCKEKFDPSGSGARLEVDKPVVSAPALGCETTFEISSNCYWDIAVEDIDGKSIGWVEVGTSRGQGDATVNVTVKANIKTESRLANIIVSTPSSKELTQTIRVVQEPGETPTFEGYKFPICQNIDIDSPETRLLTGAIIVDSICLFNEGLEISWPKTNGKLSLFCPSHTQPSAGDDADKSIHRSIYFTNFNTGDSLYIKIPVKDELFGDLRLILGARNASFTTTDYWTYYWGTDGENWNKIDVKCAITPGSDPVWNMIYFTIPETAKVKTGGNLYFKLKADNWTKAADKQYICISNTICVDRAKVEASTIPAMDNTTIAYSNGFNDLLDSYAADVYLPAGLLCSATTGYATNYTTFSGAYMLPAEYQAISGTNGCFERPGYLQLGNYDESLWTRQCIGTFTIKLGERLKLMGVSSADATLTFDAYKCKDFRGYDPLAKVTVTVTTEGSDPIVFTPEMTIGTKAKCTLAMTYVNQSTTIDISCPKLSSEEITALGRGAKANYLLDYRFYIDELLVELTQIHSKGTSTDGNNEEFNNGTYNW